MPIYEYACPDCGHRFEQMQRISEDPIKVCPSCSKDNVRKLISASAFVLKGSGWYKDHYGLKSSSDGGSDSGGSSSSSSSSSTASTPSSSSSASTPASTPAASSGGSGSSGSST